ncbi:MAG TPA: DNA gyrase inhibitor YacG [Chromobacteriaceae bacterium]|nr:DNA gyrase inhibitor YacG [Chromobacteriaceae bacterium]
MADSPLVVHCPTCQAPVRWEAASRYRPFCSERCKLIDLGQWATESYRVPAEEEPPDSEWQPPALS